MPFPSIEDILRYFRDPYREDDEGYGWGSGAAPMSRIDQLPNKLEQKILYDRDVAWEGENEFTKAKMLPDVYSAPRELRRQADLKSDLKAPTREAGRQDPALKTGGKKPKSPIEVTELNDFGGLEGEPRMSVPNPGTIEIEGLEYDPYSREVLRPDGMSPADVIKLIAIRSQAAQKGRGGSLMSAPGSEPSLDDIKGAMSSANTDDVGSFSQGNDSAGLRQREDERALYVAGHGGRMAELLLSQQETRDDPGTIPAAEELRRISGQKVEEAETLMGNRILEAAKDESGLIPPQAAWNYSRLTGQEVPPELIGLDFQGATSEMFEIRGKVEYTSALLARSDPYGGMSADYRRKAIQAITWAEERLAAGVNPNIIMGQLRSKLALIEPLGGQGMINPDASQRDVYNQGGPGGVNLAQHGIQVDRG